jgi:hypothetical protein
MPLRHLSFLIPFYLFAAPIIAADAHPSDPKAAMKAFYQAMEAGDAAAVRAAFFTTSDAEKKLAEADAAQLIAARALGEAAKNKFAATGDALSKGLPVRDQVSKLESAEVKFDGDNATLKLTGQSRPLKLIKSNNKWLISIADYAGATPANIAAQTAVLKDLAEAYSSIAADISADKFPSAQDAQKALQQKLQAVVANALHKHPPTSGATTKPK